MCPALINTLYSNIKLSSSFYLIDAERITDDVVICDNACMGLGRRKKSGFDGGHNKCGVRQRLILTHHDLFP